MRRAHIVIGLLFVALALPLGAFAGAQVPFKGSDVGRWGQGSHDCGTLFPVAIDEGVGNATHVGRYAYAARECVDFGQYPFPYAGTFTITAANGDTIVGSYAGTATIADDGVTILYEQTAAVAGGTGRFADATGAVNVSGIARSDGSYFQELDGAVSSVGASK